jgi:RNA polymerase sigma factor (sigma-70 family)
MTPDTARTGQGNHFPSTLWSQVVNAGDKDTQTRLAAWEELASRYWKPVYACIRARWHKTPDEVMDLTQEFFAWMMETGFPSKADPRRGRFRIFIRSAIDSYLKMELRSRGRQKRGGGKRIVSLETLRGDAASDVPDLVGVSPQSAFECLWKRELLTRATRILKESYLKEEKETYYRVFHSAYLDGTSKATHQELSAKHGISPSDVNNYVMDAKRRLREILKDLLAETVGGSEELQGEYRELFGDEEA